MVGHTIHQLKGEKEMPGTNQRLYIVEERNGEGSPILVWAGTQGAAVATVLQDKYSVHVASQKELCEQVAKGNNPINDPPDE